MPTTAKTKNKNKKLVRKAKKVATAPAKKRLTKAEKLQKLKREIAKRNRVFEAASPAEKRVLIAKDVIAQIKAKRYRARTQTWVQPEWRGEAEIFGPEEAFGPEASMRELFLNKDLPACNCCALGAMFMSCTLYNNNQSLETFEEEVAYDFDVRVEDKSLGGFSNGFDKFFSRDQLQLIEAAYEGGMGAFDAPISKHKAVYAWMDRLPNAAKRMVAIMENIIENKGTFVP